MKASYTKNIKNYKKMQHVHNKQRKLLLYYYLTVTIPSDFQKTKESAT